MINNKELIASNPNYFINEVLGTTAKGHTKLEIFDISKNKRFYMFIEGIIKTIPINEEKLMEINDRMYQSYLKELEVYNKNNKKTLVNASQFLMGMITPINQRHIYLINDGSFNIHGYTVQFEYINSRLSAIHTQRLYPIEDQNCNDCFKVDANGAKCFDFNKSSTQQLLKKQESKNFRLNSFSSLKQYGTMVETSTMVNSNSVPSYLHGITLTFKEPLCIKTEPSHRKLAKNSLNKVVRLLSVYKKAQFKKSTKL